jgi:hypothetical protein
MTASGLRGPPTCLKLLERPTGSTDRVSTSDDPIDQFGDGVVLFGLNLGTSGITWRHLENAHDLVFWQDVCIVQRKKQRRNSKRATPEVVLWSGHTVLPSWLRRAVSEPVQRHTQSFKYPVPLG